MSSLPPPSSLISCSTCKGYGSPFNSKSTKNCKSCSGLGVIPSSSPINLRSDSEKFKKNVIIIGAGIGGPSLYIALRQRGISSLILDRDPSPLSRSQGYGLTLQQGVRAVRQLGFDVDNLVGGESGECVYSDRHLVMDVEGEVKGEWGRRKWKGNDTSKHNIHISRLNLRNLLLKQCRSEDVIWNSGLSKVEESESCVKVTTENGEVYTGDYLIGSDGIRSPTRKYLQPSCDLNFLKCYVMLGILPKPPNDICDGNTVFQVSDGSTRFYSMPFDSKKYMWQLSFPVEEEEGGMKGCEELKMIAREKCRGWKYVEEMVDGTEEEMISGYNVYDRDVVEDFGEREGRRVGVIGDAAHPMSPFKGQGANQAILDGLKLSRVLARYYNKLENSNTPISTHETLLTFEKEMMSRAGDRKSVV